MFAPEIPHIGPFAPSHTACGGGGAACSCNLLMHCVEVPGHIRSGAITILFWMIHRLRNCDKHYCWRRFKPFYFTIAIKEQTLEFALKIKMKLNHKYNDVCVLLQNIFSHTSSTVSGMTHSLSVNHFGPGNIRSTIK